jgi:signal transduction histidine kinase
MLRAIYVASFVTAGIICFGALWRSRGISHRETRYGLYSLLITSGLWAFAQAVRLSTSTVVVATISYTGGLIAGFATVFSWLYFCSAYAGHEYHQQGSIRLAALVMFVVVTVLKLTNPLHGQYFVASVVSDPFTHVAIELGTLHWIVLFVAYAGSAIGFYILFETFRLSEIPTTQLVGIVSLAAWPVLLDVAGLVTGPQLLTLNYEPIGVAAFALGTLYVATTTFEQVRWTGHQQVLDQLDEAIIIVGEDGVIWETNAAAARLLPAVEVGQRMETVLPEIAAEMSAIDELSLTDGRGQMFSPAGAVADNEAGDGLLAAETDLFADAASGVVTFEQAGEPRYYMLRQTALTVGRKLVGQALVFMDVTRVERQRRELKRQSEQLEGFGAAVAHELRNALGIIDGQFKLLAVDIEQYAEEDAEARIQTIQEVTERMYTVIDDLTTLARLGQRINEPDWIDFERFVQQGESIAGAEEIDVQIEGEGRIKAGPTRLKELVRYAVRLGVETDASVLSISLTERGFIITTDGETIRADDADELFEYGSAVPHAEAGVIGANMRTIVRAHGWEITVKPERTDGICLVVTGCETDLE